MRIYRRFKRVPLPAKLMAAILALLSGWGTAVVWSTSQYRHVEACLPIGLFVGRHMAFLVLGVVLFWLVQNKDADRAVSSIPWFVWNGISLLIACGLYCYLDHDCFFRPLSLSVLTLRDVDGKQVGEWLGGTIDPAVAAALLFGVSIVAWSRRKSDAPDAPESADPGPSEVAGVRWHLWHGKAWLSSHGGGAALLVSALFLVGLLDECCDYEALALLFVVCVPALWLIGRRTLAAVCVGATTLWIAAAFIGHPYRIARLKDWFAVADGQYARLHSCFAFFRGGLRGTGPFGSAPDQFFVLDSGSTFTASIIADEYGLLGFLAVTALWTVFCCLCLLALRMKTDQGGAGSFSLLHLGLSVTVCVVLSHFALNTGLSPAGHYPLPLFSHSGAQVLLIFFAGGLAYRRLAEARPREEWKIQAWQRGRSTAAAAFAIWCPLGGSAAYVAFHELPLFEALHAPGKMPPLKSNGCIDMEEVERTFN